MAKFITKVTVTGADDTTDIAELLAIAEQYPFVEFGILLSRKQMGAARFPSAKWLDMLAQATLTRPWIHMAGHICGSWVREILTGKFPKSEFVAIHRYFDLLFDRFQLNTHAEPHSYDFESLQFLINNFAFGGQKFIIQNDGVNSELLKLSMIQTLFDLSHGAGLLPSEWPKPIPGIECGYAGGLSPDNVVEQIQKIETIIGDNAIWIDAETHLRSNNTNYQLDAREEPHVNYFDLIKVRKFLEAAKPYVKE